MTKHPIIQELTKHRQMLKLTQIDIAKKMGTRASIISRLEKGIERYDHSPTLRTLESYAKALGGKIIYKIEVDKK